MIIGYEAYHSNREQKKIFRLIKIAAAVVMIVIISYMCGKSARADTAIIYSPEVKVVEIGISPEDAAKSAAKTTESAVKTQQDTESTVNSNMNQHEYSSIKISDSEMEELRRVVAAEAQTQSMEGRRAVVEVIFNRVLSDKFPNTVHGVLSQKGQFATWKMRNASWVVPDAAVAAIEYVMENGRTVMPDTSYLYFDTSGVNGKKHIKIGAHYFGRG